MTLADDYEPRFTFGITEEQKKRADKLLYQYGMRKAVFQPILDDILNIIEKHGYKAVGIIMDRPRDVIPTMKKTLEECEK